MYSYRVVKESTPQDIPQPTPLAFGYPVETSGASIFIGEMTDLLQRYN
ncbi:MAG: hypothetical protein OJF51_003912 [Nitrospira sp.]|nr:MAG: hypothetical protein OJF51_003912 [Nitrospira sp.]